MDPTAVTAPPARRNNSWSLRRIVRDVSGQPLEAFQDPALPPHPYVTYVTTGRLPDEPTPEPRDELFDPPVVARPLRLPPSVPRAEPPSPPRARPPPPPAPAPPLASPPPALDTQAPEHVEFPLETPGPADAPPAATYRRPERIYLHQLLLHLDRLDENALRHLQSEVTEELEHRSAVRRPAPDRS
jgi:hypothetical protein